MRIEGSNSAMTNLRNAPKVEGGSAGTALESPKSLGELPPTAVALEEAGQLAELFAPGGMVSRLKRRLNKLKGKKCRVTPAKGTIACIDGHDLVYLGLEFLHEFRGREDVIAGVMAHEWGHACAEKPSEEEIQSLNWNQIFEMRRAHEVLADEISGRMLALLGYEPDGLIEFLLREKDTHNLKYHAPFVRSEIIRRGFQDEKRKITLAADLFPNSTYSNHYKSKLIDDDI